MRITDAKTNFGGWVGEASHAESLWKMLQKGPTTVETWAVLFFCDNIQISNPTIDEFPIPEWERLLGNFLHTCTVELTTLHITSSTYGTNESTA
jgi:hypothetical protein